MNTINVWKIKAVITNAILPVKAHPTDLGYDLFAAEDVTISEGETALVRTGIACNFPRGWGAIIRDRSSVATRRRLHVVAGVIDNGYTGEIRVALHYPMGDGLTSCSIRAGEKIAQLLPYPVVSWILQEVDSLEETDRAERGFGSSGV